MQQSPARDESERLLRKLHDLIREGKLESEEAENIREEMADHWVKMTPKERTEINELSAQLYKEAGM